MSLPSCVSLQAASQLIKGMLQLLKENKDLLVRKRLYIEMGCRGDWPQVSAPRPQGLSLCQLHVRSVVGPFRS